MFFFIICYLAAGKNWKEKQKQTNKQTKNTNKQANKNTVTKESFNEIWLKLGDNKNINIAEKNWIIS